MCLVWLPGRVNVLNHIRIVLVLVVYLTDLLEGPERTIASRVLGCCDHTVTNYAHSGQVLAHPLNLAVLLLRFLTHHHTVKPLGRLRVGHFTVDRDTRFLSGFFYLRNGHSPLFLLTLDLYASLDC